MGLVETLVLALSWLPTAVRYIVLAGLATFLIFCFAKFIIYLKELIFIG